jgi:hypothetical protein
MVYRFRKKMHFKIWYNRPTDLMHVECAGVSIDALKLRVFAPLTSEFNPEGENPPPRFYMVGRAKSIKYESKKNLITVR